MELDATQASRDIINKRVRAVIEEASIGWCVDVTRVELQSVEPPRENPQSMEALSPGLGYPGTPRAVGDGPDNQGRS